MDERPCPIVYCLFMFTDAYEELPPAHGFPAYPSAQQSQVSVSSFGIFVDSKGPLLLLLLFLSKDRHLCIHVYYKYTYSVRTNNWVICGTGVCIYQTYTACLAIEQSKPIIQDSVRCMGRWWWWWLGGL